MRPIVIPFSTLALNLDARYVQKVDVEIQEYKVSTNLKCTIFETSPINAKCDGDFMLNFFWQKGTIRKVFDNASSYEMKRPRIFFNNFEMENPPYIPENYIYPFPLLFNQNATMEEIVRKFATEYFALSIPFSILCLCIPMHEITLDGVIVEDSFNKSFLIKSWTKSDNQKLLVKTNFIFDPLTFDFGKRVVFFRGKVLSNPILNYGGPKTENTPVISDNFKCNGPLVPLSPPFAYERALRMMNFASIELIDPISLKINLNLKSRNYLPSTFIDELIKKTTNECVKDVLNRYRTATTSVERHLYAKREFLKELLPPFDVKQSIEFHTNKFKQQSNYATKIKRLKELETQNANSKTFIDYSFDQLNELLANPRTSNIDKYLILEQLERINESAKYGFEKDAKKAALQKQKAQILKEDKALTFINRTPLTKFEKKEIENLQEEITLFEEEKKSHENDLNIVQQYLDYYFQTNNIQLVKNLSDLLELLTNNGKKGNDIQSQKISKFGKKYFIDQMQTMLKQKNVKDVESVWRELDDNQKLLWYYLSQYPNFPNNYERLSLIGFVQLIDPTCKDSILALL